MDLRCPDVQIPEIEMLDILKSSILSYLSYLITFEVDGPELLRSCSVQRWHIYTHLAEGLYQGVYPGYPKIGPFGPHSEALVVFEAVGLRLYVHSKGI